MSVEPMAVGYVADTASLILEPWLSTEDVARLLRVDASTLRRWRTARPVQGPPFVRLSNRVVMYHSRDLQQWLANRRIVPGVA